MMKKIFLMAAMALTTFFAACDKDNDGNLYNVSVTASEGGTVAGDNGKHSYGEELTFVAIPITGYSFSCWSDGVKTNPRTIIVNSDVALVALFANNNENSGENNNTNNGENGNNSQYTSDSPDYFIEGYWDGSLPIRESQVSLNYSSQFYFSDENGNKNGIEECYYKGNLDNSYNFTWEWADASHSVLIINYGGNWADNKCCIDIQEFNEDHIYGYFYKTMADYTAGHKSNSGTKVELKHLDLPVELNELTVFANADGTIEIGGNFKAKCKPKEFCLLNADGSVAYDFSKQYNGAILDFKSTGRLPIANYTLSIKTINSSVTETIGADYSFNVGTGANPQLGSYISLIDQKPYKSVDFYDRSTGVVSNVANTIELFLGGEGDDVSLRSAKTMKIATTTSDVRTQAIADANKAKLADARVYENVVFTTTNCIASYKLTKVDDITYEISGVMINSKGNYKVDVSAAFAN